VRCRISSGMSRGAWPKTLTCEGNICCSSRAEAWVKGKPQLMPAPAYSWGSRRLLDLYEFDYADFDLLCLTYLLRHFAAHSCIYSMTWRSCNCVHIIESVAIWYELECMGVFTNPITIYPWSHNLPFVKQAAAWSLPIYNFCICLVYVHNGVIFNCSFLLRLKINPMRELQLVHLF
jgi:hypothetical protein